MSCIQVQGLFVWGKVLQNVNVTVSEINLIIYMYVMCCSGRLSRDSKVLLCEINCDVC